MLEFTFDGEPLNEDRIFKIGVQKYHYSNFTEFFGVPIEEVEAIQKGRVVATSTREILEEYLMANQHLDHEIDGRLTLL